MALDGYLKLVGQAQGLIRGSVTQKGREGLIRIRAAEHLVTSPVDQATLQMTGQRVFSPFSVVKEVDLASVPLRAAHANGERFGEWELKLWRPQKSATGGAGIERQHFTIRLHDAQIQQVRFVLPDNRDPALASRLDFEEVAFVYARIEWTWNDPKTSHIDSVGAKGKARRKR